MFNISIIISTYSVEKNSEETKILTEFIIYNVRCHIKVVT